MIGLIWNHLIGQVRSNFNPLFVFKLKHCRYVLSVYVLRLFCHSVKAKALNDFFGSVHVNESPLDHSLPIYMYDDKPDESLRFRRFTVSEVVKKMKYLKANKGSGPDCIHVNVLRNTPAFAEPLCEIFNDSVCSGILPQDWKDGNITPLHKKGSKQTSSNYRPVTLTSQVVKLLERLN